MKMWKLVLPVMVVMLWAGQTIAQSRDQDVERSVVARDVAIAERLRDAEERMEKAAREIAKITAERLPQVARVGRFSHSNKPRIGITIDGEASSESVEGVKISGVTPEGAADEAGLRAGDIITAVNGEPMTADNSYAANKVLLEFMHGVEEGDELQIEYLRNGKAGSVELSPRVMEMQAFSWIPGAEELHMPNAPGLAFLPKSIEKFSMNFGFRFAGSAWGRMELIKLNEGLGKYFGTNSGLLVVNAPPSAQFDLRDGDVIQTIDGREPKDVRHAMRILASYQSGETLKLGIMRDQKKRTIEVEVPADYRGAIGGATFVPPALKPARVPVYPKAPRDAAST